MPGGRGCGRAVLAARCAVGAAEGALSGSLAWPPGCFGVNGHGTPRFLSGLSSNSRSLIFFFPGVRLIL